MSEGVSTLSCSSHFFLRVPPRPANNDIINTIGRRIYTSSAMDTLFLAELSELLRRGIGGASGDELLPPLTEGVTERA